mmetsp:Transcript_50498/g.51382  ORF Transcript_50498/g.51382 Transcript_50498/m.51382 type:complete len:83 (-) Transcript_50498:2700-2948(-)
MLSTSLLLEARNLMIQLSLPSGMVCFWIFTKAYKGGVNEKATWCFRARVYSSSESPEGSSNKGRGKRYSSRTRSMKIERDGL